jgi:hypothetical protein
LNLFLWHQLALLNQWLLYFLLCPEFLLHQSLRLIQNQLPQVDPVDLLPQWHHLYPGFQLDLKHLLHLILSHPGVLLHRWLLYFLLCPEILPHQWHPWHHLVIPVDLDYPLNRWHLYFLLCQEHPVIH